MVRVIFLLAQKDREYRQQLVTASINGARWVVRGSRKKITDAEMVELAQGLQHWALSVYKFGCAFIHLSNLHDHTARDPLRSLAPQERQAILAHLRFYHGGPEGAAPSFADIVPYCPCVLTKIASNLEAYLLMLEHDADLGDEWNESWLLKFDESDGVTDLSN